MHLSQTSSEGIYLDHAATTPLDPQVLEAMLPYFTEQFGNPSSFYQQGQEARAAVDHSRRRVASVLNCDTAEVLFTSGATESDNLALRGVAWAARLAQGSAPPPPHIVTTAIEHHAVLHTAEALQRQGFLVSYVAPDSDGSVKVDAIARALRPETCLISVMYANNEMGAIQPIREIAALARARGIPVHTDAVQAAGTHSIDVADLGVDLLSLSAHKFYGPKGVGMLFVRRGTPIEYQQVGGGQEQGRRGGTENVPGIIGLGLALERADAWKEAYWRHCAALRDRLMGGMLAALPGAFVNEPVDPGRRLANNLNITIPGLQGETLLLSLDMMGIAASAGSACTTGNTEPSHVLRAMGLTDEDCRSTLRFTVGRHNTMGQMDETVAALVESVNRARALSGSMAR